MIALSYSRLENTKCPYRFYRLYIKKDYKEPMHPAATLGVQLHAITAKYRLHCLDNGLKRDLDWFSKNREPNWPWELVTKYRDSHFSLVPPKVQWYCVESKYNFDADLNVSNNGRDIAFRLIPDFAFVRNNTLYVEDDKSGVTDPGTTQSKLYPALLLRTLPKDITVNRVAFRYNMIVKNQSIVHGPIPASETLLEVDNLKNTMKAVNNWEEFPKKWGKLCNYCKICEVEG